MTADSAAALGGPEWLRTARIAAAERFAATALPDTAREEWRYSRIDSLDLDRYSAAPRPADRPEIVGLARRVLDGLSGSQAILTHNGWAPADLSLPVSRAGSATESAGIVGLAELAGEPDAFVAANRAFSPDPLLLDIPAGATVEEPVLVVHWVSGEDLAVFPRLHIRAGDNSQATVVEMIAGPGGCLAAPVTEIDLGRSARLRYLHLQDLTGPAWQVALQASRLAADATLESGAVALGGEYARMRTDSALAGAGGTSRLSALYFGSGAQMHDFRTLQHHQAPKTMSDLFYKGVVANTSRAVYGGLIRVDKGARGTNAFQANRNLVLHHGAHADSVPNLEIEDNDVRCSHASAVGPVSEDQRFYLESRGVPRGVTDRLIALGFLAEAVERLPLQELAPALTEALEAKLNKAEAEEGRAK